MSEKYDELALRDFIAWVKYRQPHGGKINDESLKYVAQGVERFLEGKTPWKKAKGNKPKSDLMWRIFYKCFFDENYNHITQEYSEIYSKRHKEPGGLYFIIAQELNLSPDNIESHFRKAKKIYETQDGKIEFMQWFAKYKNATAVKLTLNQE